MKYMLLIQQGDTPTPNSPEAWGRLSEDEQKEIYGAYQGVNDEERPSTNRGRVTFWIAVVILVLLLVPLVLIYLASQTLMSS